MATIVTIQGTPVIDIYESFDGSYWFVTERRWQQDSLIGGRVYRERPNPVRLCTALFLPRVRRVRQLLPNRARVARQSGVEGASAELAVVPGGRGSGEISTVAITVPPGTAVARPRGRDASQRGGHGGCWAGGVAFRPSEKKGFRRRS
jgi:hypothetical protein